MEYPKSFIRSFDRFLGFSVAEGEFIAPSGNKKSMYGLTTEDLKGSDFQGKLADLDRDQAMSIVYSSVWEALNLTEIAGQYEEIAYEMYVVANNISVEKAGTWLQKMLNILADSDLKEDGVIGEKTIEKFLGFCSTSSLERKKMVAESIRYLYGGNCIVKASKGENVTGEYIRSYISKRLD